MKASDFVAEFLWRRGVTHVFELCGGMITHLLDSMHRHGKIQLISVHHEQAAAFAAEGMARITGIPGVAMATSGPGATNLLTGVGSCYFDSTPAVFITGQVNRAEQKGTREVRQIGFQECDIAAMARPITKAAWQVQSPDELARLLAWAFRVAVSDRPGPVLLDIPMDVQRTDLPDAGFGGVTEPARKAPPGLREACRDVLDQIDRAERPLVLAGGGIRAAGAAGPLRAFAAVGDLPVVHSLMAVDVLAAADRHRVGMIGTYGNRWANLALTRCDFLLVLGSRLDVRQTGADVEAFRRDRTIIHVDCDRAEINNRVTGCLPVESDVGLFLEAIVAEARERRPRGRGAWIDEISALKAQWPDVTELDGIPGINPNRLMHALAAVSAAAGAYVVDVGQNQMWAAQSLDIGPEQRMMTSGGMGAMGFALPAAIGTAFACKRPVVVVTGDGGIQINLQEFQTIVHHRLPIKVVVLNNHCLGMVRQFQESYFESRFQSTVWGYDCPNIEKVAAAYGIPSLTVAGPDEVARGLEFLWRDPPAPALLQVQIDPMTNVYPKVSFGSGLEGMEPVCEPPEGARDG